MKAAQTPTANLEALTKLAHVLYEGTWYAVPSALTQMYEMAGMMVSTAIPFHLSATAGWSK